MRIKQFLLATAFATAGVSAAHAGPFGPATASLGSFDVPTVTLNNSAGTGTVKLNGGTDQLSAGTGNFATGTYTGSGSGTISFSETAGVTVANLINSLFSFSDNQGGYYVFNLASAETVNFSNAPGVSSSIGLYLLGTMGDTNLGLSNTATSVTMTFNSTGTSNYSESGSLSNPPTTPVIPQVPEPASLALLGAGLAAVGFVRRRK